MTNDMEQRLDMTEGGRRCTVVLLHGGWHCSASWWKVTALLRVRGHDVVAPELPGHGARARFPQDYLFEGQPGLGTAASTLTDVSLEAAADEVVALLRALRDQARHHSLVLVSHSSSGAIASLAAEKAPEAVDRLVYVAAIVPSRLTSAAEVGALPEYGSRTMDGLVVGDPATTRCLRINPRSTDLAYRALLRSKFYGDLSVEEAEAFLNLLIPDQPVRFITDPVTVTADRWGTIPRTYVHTTKDRSIARPAQAIMVDDADALCPRHPFQRIEIDSSHCPFASRPGEVVDAILGVAAHGRR